MSTAVAARPGRVRLARLLYALFFVAVALATGFVLRASGPEVLALLSRPEGRWYLALVVVALAAGMALAVAAWRSGFAGLGTSFGYGVSWRIYALMNLGKYLPGKVWAVVVAVKLAGEQGVPPRRTLAATALNMLVVMAAAAAVGMLVAPSLLGLRTGWLVAPLLAGVVMLWRPDLVVVLANRVARWLRREPVSERPDASRLRWAMLSHTLAWLVGGVHLWLIAVLLGAEPAAAFPLCVGSFALATVAGGLVFVLPDGVGVRELVTIGALTAVLPAPEAGAAALVSRGACVLVDVAAALGALANGRGCLVRAVRSVRFTRGNEHC